MHTGIMHVGCRLYMVKVLQLCALSVGHFQCCNMLRCPRCPLCISSAVRLLPLLVGRGAPIAFIQLAGTHKTSITSVRTTNRNPVLEVQCFSNNNACLPFAASDREVLEPWPVGFLYRLFLRKFAKSRLVLNTSLLLLVAKSEGVSKAWPRTGDGFERAGQKAIGSSCAHQSALPGVTWPGRVSFWHISVNHVETWYCRNIFVNMLRSNAQFCPPTLMTKKAGGWKMIVVMSCALEPIYCRELGSCLNAWKVVCRC